MCHDALQMKITTLAEGGETRVALTPPAVQQLAALGAEVLVPRGLGASLGFADEAYEKAGARLLSAAEALAEAEVLALVGPPENGLLERLEPGTVLVGFLDPFRNLELVRQLAQKGVSALSVELIPRSSYAQKMDALSSQASLAGYAAVIKAAERLPKALPMMSTPAGTIPPARVFVLGAGVAGLQAIATARRLGARVEAFDTRPVVEEQVQSLGAKFVKIDVGETGQTEQGYAKELSAEQLELQRQGMAKVIAASDVVITTAQIFGRPAPRIVSREMVLGMRPGSVVVDLAAATGGNVEGTVANEEVLVGGVRLVGLVNLPGAVARDASQMYASNVANLLEHLWHEGGLELASDDEIARSVLLTHQGEIRNARVRELLEAKT